MSLEAECSTLQICIKSNNEPIQMIGSLRFRSHLAPDKVKHSNIYIYFTGWEQEQTLETQLCRKTKSEQSWGCRDKSLNHFNADRHGTKIYHFFSLKLKKQNSAFSTGNGMGMEAICSHASIWMWSRDGRQAPTHVLLILIHSAEHPSVTSRHPRLIVNLHKLLRLLTSALVTSPRHDSVMSAA